MTKKPKAKSKPLTASEKLFIEEYASGARLSSALARAGLNTAHSLTVLSQLRQNPAFVKAFEARQEVHAYERVLTDARILDELAAAGFADIADYYHDDGTIKTLDEIPYAARRAIVGVRVRSVGAGDSAREVIEYELADKMVALDKLGRHKKLFADNEPRNIGITINQRSDDELVARLMELTRKAGLTIDQPQQQQITDAQYEQVSP